MTRPESGQFQQLEGQRAQLVADHWNRIPVPSPAAIPGYPPAFSINLGVKKVGHVGQRKATFHHQ